MTTGKICSRIVATVWPTETVRAAALRMAENDVGSLVVIEADGLHRPIGILTDRDIAVRCVGGRLDPDKTPVSTVMTTRVHTIDEQAAVEDALSQMAAGGTRRLIVTGRGERLVGVLSLDDVLDLLTTETAAIGKLLDKQRPHVTA
ncbi:MAG TPA: CBS domain-containing protein [Gemmatimonadales bacterium]|nr:CBS domain-containing protein [Gemmatimonadales bacterium]